MRTTSLQLAFALTLFVVPGCSSAPAQRSVSETLGPEGGSVALGGTDLVVSVPPGALAAPTEIGLADVLAAEVAALPAGGGALSRRYALTPHGTVFDEPVEITIPYEGTPDGVSVLRLDDEADPTWEPLTGVTLTGGVATFATDRFSVVVVSGPITDNCGDPGERCCTANPDIDDQNGDGCSEEPNSYCHEDSCLACRLTTSTLFGSCAGGFTGESCSGRSFCRDLAPMDPPIPSGPGYEVLCCD
jgi:hypothetical protein